MSSSCATLGIATGAIGFSIPGEVKIETSWKESTPNRVPGGPNVLEFRRTDGNAFTARHVYQMSAAQVPRVLDE